MDRDSKWHEMILRKKAQIEDINSRLAKPLPRGSHPSNRQGLIAERPHLKEVVADMQREEELRISQKPRIPQYSGADQQAEQNFETAAECERESKSNRPGASSSTSRRQMVSRKRRNSRER